jgi:hypothetical protein
MLTVFLACKISHPTPIGLAIHVGHSIHRSHWLVCQPALAASVCQGLAPLLGLVLTGRCIGIGIGLAGLLVILLLGSALPSPVSRLATVVAFALPLASSALPSCG